MGRGFVLLHDAIQLGYLSFVAGFLFVLFTLFNSVIPVAKKKYFLIGTVIALTMIVCILKKKMCIII